MRIYELLRLGSRYPVESAGPESVLDPLVSGSVPSPVLSAAVGPQVSRKSPHCSIVTFGSLQNRQPSPKKPTHMGSSSLQLTTS